MKQHHLVKQQNYYSKPISELYNNDNINMVSCYSSNNQKIKRGKQMELKIEEVKKIEEGKQIGKIVGVEYREKPYEYTDLIIEMQNGMKMKYGLPTSVTIESRLGKALIAFGASLEVGGTTDPDKVFIGKGCTFLVTNEKTDRGTFAKIVPNTLKPVEVPK